MLQDWKVQNHLRNDIDMRYHEIQPAMHTISCVAQMNMDVSKVRFLRGCGPLDWQNTWTEHGQVEELCLRNLRGKPTDPMVCHHFSLNMAKRGERMGKDQRYQSAGPTNPMFGMGTSDSFVHLQL